MEPKREDHLKEDKGFKERMRAFWDFFVLFSGISTARNLSYPQESHPYTRRVSLSLQKWKVKAGFQSIARNRGN